MTTRREMPVSMHGAMGSGLAMLTVDEEVPGGAMRVVTIPCDAGADEPGTPAGFRGPVSLIHAGLDAWPFDESNPGWASSGQHSG